MADREASQEEALESALSSQPGTAFAEVMLVWGSVKRPQLMECNMRFLFDYCVIDYIHF